MLNIEFIINKEISKYGKMVNELPLMEICKKLRFELGIKCDYFYVTSATHINYYVLVFMEGESFRKVNVETYNKESVNSVDCNF